MHVFVLKKKPKAIHIMLGHLNLKTISQFESNQLHSHTNADHKSKGLHKEKNASCVITFIFESDTL
jgi:hypothetical protein